MSNTSPTPSARVQYDTDGKLRLGGTQDFVEIDGNGSVVMRGSAAFPAYDLTIEALTERRVTIAAPDTSPDPGDPSVATGEYHLVGSLAVKVLEDADAGDPVLCATAGEHVVAKSDDTGPVFALGAVVFYDPTSKLANTTGTSRFPIGVCLEAAADDDASVRILLNAVTATAVG